MVHAFLLRELDAEGPEEAGYIRELLGLFVDLLRGVDRLAWEAVQRQDVRKDALALSLNRVRVRARSSLSKGSRPVENGAGSSAAASRA